MCMRLRNAGKGEASPSLFPRFAPNTHIYLYASTVHMQARSSLYANTQLRAHWRAEKKNKDQKKKKKKKE